jgi:putative hydrolase of the HAD superfamily
MNRLIQAILFDLGNTIIHSCEAWEPVLRRANQALTDMLCAHGVAINRETFPTEFDTCIRAYYDTRDKDLYERTTTAVLQDLLAEKGVHLVAPSILRAALDAMYAVTQENWIAEDDAAPTLRKLQAMGFRLGIVSNAADHKDVHELVEKAQIESYVDFVLTSAGCSYRKPHPRIFQMALAHWGAIKPQNVAMVGDRIDADIWGAKQMGMLTFWIERRSNILEPLPLQPDYIIESLDVIPRLLRNN